MSAAGNEPALLPDLLGNSETLVRAKDRLSLAAKVDRPILILGARGTGKELAAARLHFLSPRWKGPYVTLNCAALSPSLMDAELFGYEAGSFTGAGKRRPGRFEAADGGTLFLDEISHLTLEAQAKILRVVEYGSFQMVGSASERRIDVRVVAATNADLRRMSERGAFLADLWDRLSFEIIELPPLKDRPGDANLLAHYFGARMARELGWESPPVLSPDALSALEVYDWPGNVRELKNAIERAVYHKGFDGSGSVIAPEDLQLENRLYASLSSSERASSPQRAPASPWGQPGAQGPPGTPGPPAWLPGGFSPGGCQAGEGQAGGYPPGYFPASYYPVGGFPAGAFPAGDFQASGLGRQASGPQGGGFQGGGLQSGALHGEEAGEIGRKGKAPEEGIQGEESEGEESQRAGFDEKTRGYARSLIEEAMEASGGNQGKAAKLLGLTYHKFRAIRRKLFPKSE